MQIARPGVKRGGYPELDRAAEPFAIAPEHEQRLGGGLEQEVEDLGAVARAKLGQLARQREYNVEVVNGQQAVQPARDPARALQGLALGAVPIAARIIGRALVAAGRAALDVTAERCGPARDQIAGEAPVPRQERVLALEGVEVATEDVRHLEP